MAPSFDPDPSGRIEREKDTGRKPPYKIIREPANSKQKKLRSDFSYDIEPPSGYTFVPAGIPTLTLLCKSLSRDRDVKIFIVSVRPKNGVLFQRHTLSFHLNRIGHHFENAITFDAGTDLGYIDQSYTFIAQPQLGSEHSQIVEIQRSEQHPLGHEKKSDIANMIRDLFPKIPDSEAEAVLEKSFQKGSGKVGDAKDLSLSRRVQLAVVSHIRHNHTPYDRLWKEKSHPDARQQVAPTCLSVIKKWRQEDDTQEGIHDSIREVLVIDDDDDYDDRPSSGSPIVPDQPNQGLGEISALAEQVHPWEQVSTTSPSAIPNHRLGGLTKHYVYAPQSANYFEYHARYPYPSHYGHSWNYGQYPNMDPSHYGISSEYGNYAQTPYPPDGSHLVPTQSAMTGVKFSQPYPPSPPSLSVAQVPLPLAYPPMDVQGSRTLLPKYPSKDNNRAINLTSDKSRRRKVHGHPEDNRPVTRRAPDSITNPAVASSGQEEQAYPHTNKRSFLKYPTTTIDGKMFYLVPVFDLE